MSWSRIATLSLLAGLLLTCPLDAAEPFSLDDLGLMVRLSAPRISPDGGAVVIRVSRPDYEGNHWSSELVLVDVDSRDQRVLTFERRGLGNVRWSPSGDRLAFLAVAGSGGRQVYVMPMAGGDARRLTNAPAGVQAFEWRGDGEQIAFIAAEPEPPAAEGVERHNNVFAVGNVNYLTSGPSRPSHLWLVPAAGGEARQLTSGPESLATGFGPSPLSWSHDGARIAFLAYPTPDSGDADQSAVRVVEVASGEVSAPVVGSIGHGDAVFSPDSTRIAYSWSRDGNPSYLTEAYVVAAAGGEGRSVTRALDRDIGILGWLDETTLLVGGADGPRSALWLQPIDGTARRLDLGEVKGIRGLHLGRRGEIAFIGSESDWPSELYFMASSTSTAVRLTDFHDAIAERALGRTETIEWQGPDGMTQDGVLVYPPDFQEGGKYPLVLRVHGGPTASSGEAFSELAQLMAAQGWVVFHPNYRGSNHRGNAFQSAIADDCGEGPGRDVMAGVDAVKGLGFVDEERIAVSGWSYGGYMTAWLIGRYPEVWRAAVAGAAPVDATDMTALSDLNVMLRHCLTSSPWVGERYGVFFEQSPMAHFAKLRTPTLILSKTGDQRVTVTGSYKLFHALKDNGVPTEFYAYPGPGHFPSDPVRSRDVFRRWIDWLVRYLS
jgi:dipeptidyl aminopeptidase/acylaminoacyl peptidase